MKLHVKMECSYENIISVLFWIMVKAVYELGKSVSLTCSTVSNIHTVYHKKQAKYSLHTINIEIMNHSNIN